MLDEQGIVSCDRCGQPLNVGDYPFCPHGHGTGAVFQDGIPGGIVVENYGPTPIRFDSHSDRRRYMKEHGLQEKEKFCPLPGTSKDPQGIPNPAGYLDAKTLENAKDLICRNGQSAPEFDGVESGVLDGFFSGSITERDAIRVGDGDHNRSARLGRRIKHGSGSAP